MDDLNEKIRELSTEIKIYKEQFTDFIEAASHDLNAPLRKLSVLIDRLVSKYQPQFDDGATEYINRIQTCIREMKSLIDGLTELAQTNVELSEAESCDLNVVVKHELDLMNEEIEQRNLMVNVGSLPVVNGTAFQYKQLFRNLFENAIKFSKTDVPAELNVKAGVINDDEKKSFDLERRKKYYRIEISDNGIGFNQNFAEEIFKPFVRLHPRSEYEGSGMGLSICKKIVVNHKGRIFAEGSENGGSRFTLILPESP
jgi:signal transduction histidine kinase